MGNRIVLTVITGPHRNQRYVFDRRARCLAGRAEDCQVRFSGDVRDRQISRHHCLLDINPPLIRVSDLGSMNGTFINGKKVEPCRGCDNQQKGECVCAALESGDVLTIGGSSLSVTVVEAEHEVEIAGETVIG
jgi:pSer/pThr/pTyr-binding forkhead associated (FHA) protein